jgi:hypothetical protein
VFDAILLALSIPIVAAAARLPRWYRNLRRRRLTRAPVVAHGPD